MAQLRYKADRRTLAHLAIYAMAIAAGFFIFDAMSAPLVVLYLAFLCAMAMGTAVITHNTVHVPMWDRAGWNRATQIILSLLYGNSVSVFVRGHNYSHHGHLQTPKDLMRTTKARFRWNFLNQFLFLAIVAPAIERGNKIFIGQERKKNSAWFKQFSRERLWVLSITLVMFIVDWRVAILFVLIPRIVGLWFIAGINFAQHDGCDAEHPFNHSRNFVGRWLNWYLFNNGFHGIHHDHANLHWSLCRDAHMNEIHGNIDPRLDEISLVLYVMRACVWPGKRVRYDGKPVVLSKVEPPDESWIPDTDAMKYSDVSIGAAGS
jgi:beta-carotene hydroxylase